MNYYIIPKDTISNFRDLCNTVSAVDIRDKSILDTATEFIEFKEQFNNKLSEITFNQSQTTLEEEYFDRYITFNKLHAYQETTNIGEGFTVYTTNDIATVKITNTSKLIDIFKNFNEQFNLDLEFGPASNSSGLTAITLYKERLAFMSLNNFIRFQIFLMIIHTFQRSLSEDQNRKQVLSRIQNTLISMENTLDEIRPLCNALLDAEGA